MIMLAGLAKKSCQPTRSVLGEAKSATYQPNC